MKTLMELVDKCKPFEYSYDKDTAELFLKAEELKEKIAKIKCSLVDCHQCLPINSFLG